MISWEHFVFEECSSGGPPRRRDDRGPRRGTPGPPAPPVVVPTAKGRKGQNRCQSRASPGPAPKGPFCPIAVSPPQAPFTTFGPVYCLQIDSLSRADLCPLLTDHRPVVQQTPATDPQASAGGGWGHGTSRSVGARASDSGQVPQTNSNSDEFANRIRIRELHYNRALEEGRAASANSG